MHHVGFFTPGVVHRDFRVEAGFSGPVLVQGVVSLRPRRNCQAPSLFSFLFLFYFFYLLFFIFAMNVKARASSSLPSIQGTRLPDLNRLKPLEGGGGVSCITEPPSTRGEREGGGSAGWDRTATAFLVPFPNSSAGVAISQRHSCELRPPVIRTP